MESAASKFDINGVVEMITGAMKGVIGLVVEFPLNIFLGATVIGIGVSLFKKLKH